VFFFMYHKQTKIFRSTQHFNVVWPSATCFSSYEPPSGTLLQQFSL